MIVLEYKEKGLAFFSGHLPKNIDKDKFLKDNSNIVDIRTPNKQDLNILFKLK